MAKFNVKENNKTENLAGGQAFKQTPEMELASILLTSMLNKDQYYRSTDETVKRLGVLVGVVNPLFAAKAAVYARNEFGLRSITHVLASQVAKNASGMDWSRNFYDKIVRRVDDMLEILAFHGVKNMTNAMKEGFSRAFDRFDNYQLAKYMAKGKDVNLVDLVRLVHPKPTMKNKEALKQLVEGNLKSTETWEAKKTKAGQVAKTEEERAEFDAMIWGELVKERKIGYFALLRNLRNIYNQAPDVVPTALEMLTDKRLIKASLVLPFRYVMAYKEVATLDKQFIDALNKAIDISVDNVPRFEGKTLVVADFSGSMGVSLSDKRGQATLFGVALAKANNADFMIFGDRASYVPINNNDSTMTSVNYLLGLNTGWGGNYDVGHGTNFSDIFNVADKVYDRIVIFSDMQGWVGYYTPEASVKRYKDRTGADPHIYSVDMSGYGTSQFNGKVYQMAGYSDKMFDIMKLVESDKKALVNKINAIKL